MHTFVVAQFNLVDVTAVLLLELGLLDLGARVLGQRRLVELLERLDGAGVTQLQRLVGTQVAGHRQVGAENESGRSHQGSEGFHQ